jgi:DNA excision repair protein ERCC-2
MQDAAKKPARVARDGYAVSVRMLCEFAAKRGDLDHRFTPSPTSQEGIAGHRTVASKRSGSYKSEVTLSLEYRSLVVRGRADGYDAARGLVEEIKTFRGDLMRMAGNRRALHSAQACVYGWMLCRRDGLESIDVALVYYDIDREEEMPALIERRTAVELQRSFESLCDAFVEWADEERAHRSKRDAWLEALRFPHPSFRDGQHALATAVWRAARSGRCLVAEAPTGIGKTVGAMFPAMKAMATEEIDRLFFLTARGTGRALALGAAHTIRNANGASVFRIIDLTAREKACEHPDKSCHGDSCPLARGFYDRLPAARIAAREVAVLTQNALRDVAREHQVCPYYLGIEMARWCDLVVGDYNHWFDGYPLLVALAEENAWRTMVLVDEGHNLLERAREMYSARLDSRSITDIKSHAPEILAKPLVRLTRAWNRLIGEVPDDYLVCAAAPASLMHALRDVTTTIASQLLDGTTPPSETVMRFHFDALQLMRLAEATGDHSIFDVVVERPTGSSRSTASIGVRNLIPAPFLKPRYAAAHTTILFSATLTPHAFYADTLGLPTNTARIDVPAPFASDQLTIRVVCDISTRFRDRQVSLAPIVQLIARQYDERPGNYLVFVSSHDYLQRLVDVFSSRHPSIACWQQARRMSEGERANFLERFHVDSRGVGFAVLGGVFAEGIDLPGDRLIGAFVATLGLPQFDPVNEAHRQHHEARYGSGYEYTYLFPGIRRVVQAAGRVIRSVSDRGSLHLIDDRFARPEVTALLPSWWDLSERDSIRDITQVTEFIA